jgi:hypothetical protein
MQGYTLVSTQTLGTTRAPAGPALSASREMTLHPLQLGGLVCRLCSSATWRSNIPPSSHRHCTASLLQSQCQPYMRLNTSSFLRPWVQNEARPAASLKYALGHVLQIT